MSIWVASVPSSVFIYAGVLEAPKDVRWYNVCATHMGILWVAPPSLLGHSETFYEVKINQRNIFKMTNTTALNYTFLRPGPSGAVYANIAAWNPVGKGEVITLNITGSLSYCGPPLGIYITRFCVHMPTEHYVHYTQHL